MSESYKDFFLIKLLNCIELLFMHIFLNYCQQMNGSLYIQFWYYRYLDNHFYIAIYKFILFILFCIIYKVFWSQDLCSRLWDCCAYSNYQLCVTVDKIAPYIPSENCQVVVPSEKIVVGLPCIHLAVIVTIFIHYHFLFFTINSFSCLTPIPIFLFFYYFFKWSEWINNARFFYLHFCFRSMALFLSCPSLNW
jgi:hypothetical protein